MEPSVPRSGVPYRRLSFFYFLYFALLGCIAPFWGLYLQARNFSEEDIGFLMAAFAGVRIVAPNLWASWAGHFSSPLVMVRWSGVLTAVCFACVWWANSLTAMLLVMLAYGFFWAAMLPQYEAITMQSIKNRIDEYSRIRLWGSIGFIVIVVLLGWLFDVFDVALLPAVMLLLMLSIFLNSLLFKSANYSIRITATKRSGFMGYVFRWPVVIFIVTTVLLQISHGAYYTFFSIFLEQRGYASGAIGLLWGLGVLAEVFLFWQFSRIMKLLSWYKWLMLSLLLTALRWLLISLFSDHLFILLFAQMLHAFSFGVMHAVSMHYIQEFFPGELQAKGQALYSSVGFGLGGALGAWFSGMLWQPWGGEMVFMLSAVVAAIAMFVVAIGLRKE